MSNEPKSVRIGSGTKIHFTPSPADQLSNPGRPIYAVNWFDLKRPWLYNLYGLLAIPHVRKVDGRVHFKGLLKEKWEGKPELDRSNLLIVRYPDADSFLSMLTSKLFLLKSVLRIHAVKDFVFGFTRRMDNGPDPAGKTGKYGGSACYLVHIFSNESNGNGMPDGDQIRSLRTENDQILHFYGIQTATLGRSKDGGKVKDSPFFIAGILVWEANEFQGLKQLINRPAYQRFKEPYHNQIYVFDRVY